MPVPASLLRWPWVCMSSGSSRERSILEDRAWQGEKDVWGFWLLLQNVLLADLIRSLPSAPKWAPDLTDLESVVGWDIMRTNSCFQCTRNGCLNSEGKAVLPIWRLTKFHWPAFRKAWIEFHHGKEDVNSGAKILHILYLFKNKYAHIDVH